MDFYMKLISIHQLIMANLWSCLLRGCVLRQLPMELLFPYGTIIPTEKVFRQITKILICVDDTDLYFNTGKHLQ